MITITIKYDWDSGALDMHADKPDETNPAEMVGILELAKQLVLEGAMHGQEFHEEQPEKKNYKKYDA